MYTRERLEYFSKLKYYKDTPILVSGGYSIWLKKKPKYGEAEVMAHYLEGKGFKNIIIEADSKDTVGNIYFSKQIIKRHPEWKNIVIVTTKGHKTRSEWIFKKLFGPKYKLSYIEVPTSTGNFGHKRRLYEKHVIGIYRKMLAGTDAGDDIAIFRILMRNHPAFSKTAKAKKVALEINSAKKHYLGFVNPLEKKNAK